MRKHLFTGLSVVPFQMLHMMEINETIGSLAYCVIWVCFYAEMYHVNTTITVVYSMLCRVLLTSKVGVYSSAFWF